MSARKNAADALAARLAAHVEADPHHDADTGIEPEPLSDNPRTDAPTCDAEIKALRKVEAEAAAAQHVAVRVHEALDALPNEAEGLRRRARRLSEAAEAVADKAAQALMVAGALIGSVRVGPAHGGWTVHVGWAVPTADGYDFIRRADAPKSFADVAAETLPKLPNDGTKNRTVRRPGFFTLSVRFHPPYNWTPNHFRETARKLRAFKRRRKKRADLARAAQPPEGERDHDRPTPAAHAHARPDARRLAGP